jgi:cyclic lactone autoinducer peptide
MRKFQTVAMKMGGVVASLALILGVSSSQMACALWFHQPKVPEGMEKFKKK